MAVAGSTMGDGPVRYVVCRRVDMIGLCTVATVLLAVFNQTEQVPSKQYCIWQSL